MANIKVPILIQERDKFGFPISQPEKGIGTETESLTDIAFLKKLGDEGKLITRSGTRTTVGTIVSIIPSNGETFYYLFGSWSIQTTGSATATLNNNANEIESVTVDSTQVTRDGLFVTKFNAMIGDGIRAFTVELDAETGATTAQASITGFIEKSKTLSSRGTTV